MAPIRFRCIRCQHAVKAPETAVGKKMYCPVCYFQLTVPPESTVKPIDTSQLYTADSSPVDVRDMKDRLNFTSLRCNVCHTNISVSKDQIGREIECPDCGTKIVVPEEIGKKIDAVLEDKLDRIMLGLDNAEKDVYGVRGGDGAPKDDWSKRFPVYCKLCGTLMYASDNQVGQELTCPDCETKNLVPPRPKQVQSEASSAFSFEGGTTFGLAGDAPEVLDGEGMLVPVVCSLCETRMYARESEIGGFKTCPDCGTKNKIKPVPKELMSTYEEISGDGYEVDAEKEPGRRPAFRTLTDYRVVDGSLDKEIWDRKRHQGKHKDRTADSSKTADSEIFGVETSEPVSAEVTNLLAGELADRLVPEAKTPEEKERERERKKKTIYEKIEEFESHVRNDRGLDLPERPFWTKVFVPFRDANVLFRMMLAAFVFVLGVFAGTVFGPGVFVVVALLAFTVIVNTGYSLFLWTAAGNDLPDRDDWFELGVAGSVAYSLWVVFVITLAAMPGLLFGQIFSSDPFPAQWTTFHFSCPALVQQAVAQESGGSPLQNIVEYAQTTNEIAADHTGSSRSNSPSTVDIERLFINLVLGTFSCWIFFPILFLSSMENDAWYALLGRGTLMSLAYETGTWIKFYGITFLLGLVLLGIPAFLELLVMLTGDMLAGFVIIPNMIALVFFPLLYFRFLGRLAWVLEDLARQARDE